MAKKKSTLGKLFAFTTTVAAIGGTCYIFRDKIRQSSIYKAAIGKLSPLAGKCDNGFEDGCFSESSKDDFEDASEDTDNNREYTSITINAKDSGSEKEPVTEEPDSAKPAKEEPVTDKPHSNDSPGENPTADGAHAPEPDNAGTAAGTTTDKDASDKPASTGIFDDSIPTINLNAFSSNPENVSAYENENLSDSSDDPDILAEQDILDF